MSFYTKLQFPFYCSRVNVKRGLAHNIIYHFSKDFKVLVKAFSDGKQPIFCKACK